MSYVYDPEVAAYAPYAPPLDVTDVEAARELIAQLGAAMPTWEPSPAVVYETHDATGVEVHVVRPAAAGAEEAPTLLWFHGGGFVLGDARESLPFLERVVVDTGAVAVSVQYRLAPETTYPGPLDDGAAVLAWLRGNAAELGIEPALIAVGGQSAGAAIAAGLALRMRDEGAGFVFQLLDIPVTDDRVATQSATEYTDTMVWNRSNAVASWHAYLAGTQSVPAYAAPARAEDLTGLPPAFVTVNQFDPLRDEALEYARRLAHAGVPVELHLYAGTFHGSSGIAIPAAISQRQDADLRAALGRAFTAAQVQE